jgi:hypothetical protein
MVREPAEVAFFLDGELCWGTMTDISLSDKRFVVHIKTEDALPALTKGRSLECCITNSMGTSKCRGIVQWIERHDGYLEWGFSTMELPADDDDPLCITIRDYCRYEKSLHCLTVFGKQRYRAISKIPR